MKEIKLSGRERAVLRAIDFTTGTTGAELFDRTKIETDELVDILNGLMEVGYVEVVPFADKTDVNAMPDAMFEVNPSYALELREVLNRRY